MTSSLQVLVGHSDCDLMDDADVEILVTIRTTPPAGTVVRTKTITATDSLFSTDFITKTITGKFALVFILCYHSHQSMIDLILQF